MAYRGETATIALGSRGLLTDIAPGQIPPDALIDSDNIVLNAGSIEKMQGSLRYNSSALSSPVVAIFDWHPTNFQQRLIAATANGSIFRDTGNFTFNGNTAIKTGLGNLTVNDRFVEGGNETAGSSKKLFRFPVTICDRKVSVCPVSCRTRDSTDRCTVTCKNL